jgi:ubiquinone/menaquinone biosynthesis C-methylase UbiE
VTANGSEERPLKVLDIAAGHGTFGITIAERHPETEVVALDWPAVLEVAKENADKAGLDGRHTRLPGNAFDVEFGNGYDVVLLTNFLHHFDVPTCTKLLRKVHGALNDGGRAVTLEFVPNEDRVSPAEQASFAMMMLATTASGDAYTFRELESMAADAGFANNELHRMVGPPQSVIVSTK